MGKKEEAPFLPFVIRSVMGQHFVAVLLIGRDPNTCSVNCVFCSFHLFIYKVLPSLGMASSVASWAAARGPVSVVLCCTDRGLTENRCRYGMQALPLSTLACMRRQAMPVLILFLLLFFCVDCCDHCSLFRTLSGWSLCPPFQFASPCLLAAGHWTTGWGERK